MIEKYSLSKAEEESKKIEKEKNQDERKMNIVAIHFDGRHFGEEERSIDTQGLINDLNKWWDEICVNNNQNPRDKNIELIGYYLMELAKNALECTDGGEIKVIFNGQKITIIVTDQGQGFDDPNDDIFASPHHGLAETKAYADEFIIETNGKKFTKLSGNKELVMTLDTDVKQGSKITLVKNY